MDSINWTLVLAVLLAVSEGLALIPSVKSNSIFQAALNVLRFVKEKLLPAKEEPKVEEAPKAE